MKLARTSSRTGITRIREIPITVEELEAWERAGQVRNALPRDLSREDVLFIISGETHETVPDIDKALKEFDAAKSKPRFAVRTIAFKSAGLALAIAAVVFFLAPH